MIISKRRRRWRIGWPAVAFGLAFLGGGSAFVLAGPGGGVTRRHALRLATAVAMVADPQGETNVTASPVDPTPSWSDATPVQVQRLQVQTGYESRLQYVGRVEPARTAMVAFERSGLVDAVMVDEGDHVVGGQPIARLNTDLLRSEREVVMARVAAAKAALDERLQGPRSEAIEQAEQRVRGAEATLALGEAQWKRLSGLLKSNSASREEYDQAYFGLKNVRAELALAQAQLLELENGTRPEQLAAQRALLAKELAELNRIDVEIGMSTIDAPFAARVGRRFVDEGTVIDPAASVVELLQSGSPRVRVGLDSSMMSQLVIGTTHSFAWGDQTISGKLIQKRADIDLASRIVDACFEIEGSTVPLCFGELLRLELTDSTKMRGAWVPTSALVESTRGLWSLMTIHPTDDKDEATTVAGRDPAGVGTTKRMDVELIHTDGPRAYVSGPIDAGVLYVSDGLHRVVNGQPVVWKLPQANDAPTIVASRGWMP